MPADRPIDEDRAEARRRIALKEQIQDPSTIGLLERIGVSDGWNCLEVGAGKGSIAAWLSREVAPTGEVVATDVDTTFLRELDIPNLVVLEHDMVADDLEPAAFDLVHARDVLVHIPEREAVLRKMANAVKLGGWIVIEEPDASSVKPDPSAPEAARRLYSKVMEAVYAFLCSKGLDPYCGSRMLAWLRLLGFGSLRSEAWCRSYQGGEDALRSPHVLAFKSIKDSIVSAGAVSKGDLQRFLALFEDPGFSWREDLTVATWGRR